MWKRRRKQSDLKTAQYTIEGQAIPVEIYRERRNGVRFSIGKQAAILRLPEGLSRQQEEEYIGKFKTWLSKRILRNEGTVAHFDTREYRDGDVLEVGRRAYTLKIAFEERKTHSGRLLPGNIIELRLSKLDQGGNLQKNIRQLLGRVVAQDFLPEVSKRVHELNARHFQRPINNIALKNTHSRLGSCSTNGNINLSTRLLFAPPEVLDYIIVHELAHLVEMNHSPRFWALVEKAMPNYVEQEKWIKEHFGKLGF
jgi:predicted metal-dependent hydrolase